jgi:hypothetical protein
MRTIAHDVIVESTTRAGHDARVMDAAARVMELSRDLLDRLADR